MPPSRRLSLPWFRVDRDLSRHPKTALLMHAGKWTRAEAVGRILMLWEWVAEYCPRGEVREDMVASFEWHMREVQLAYLARTSAFCPSMEEQEGHDFETESTFGCLVVFVDSGWLDPAWLDDGGGLTTRPPVSGVDPECLVVHDWWEMNGGHIRELVRLADRDRKTLQSLPDATRTRPGREIPVVDVDVDVDGDGDKDKKNQPSTEPTASRSASPAGSAGVRARNRQAEPESFAAWYAAFPRHIARLAAARAYRTALTRTDAATLLAGATAYAATVQGRDPDKIKHPATWLNGGCETDEAPTVNGSGDPERDEYRVRHERIKAMIAQKEQERADARKSRQP